MKSIRNAKPDTICPVTFRGISSGLFRLAKGYARQKNIGAL